jgi:drug/metabolite transporter (DMT)-like permease
MSPSVPEVQPSNPRRVALALLTVQVSFSTFQVVSKLMLRDLPSLALVGSRVVLATPILLWIAWRRDRLIPPWRELPWLALLGLLGVTLNQILFMEGLKRTTATNSAILIPSIPVFALLIGALFGVERPSGKRLVGIGLAIVGALCVVDPRRFHLASHTGDLLILSNCLAYAGFMVLQRPVLKRLPWRTVIAWSFLFGCLFLAPFTAGSTVQNVGRFSPLLTAELLYVVLIGTVVPYALNSWAIRRSSPNAAAIYTTLQPPLTALLAWALLGERLGVNQILGGALILAGLLWVTRTEE